MAKEIICCVNGELQKSDEKETEEAEESAQISEEDSTEMRTLQQLDDDTNQS